MHDEHLSVYSAAGTDPDHRDAQLAGYACGQIGGDLLQNQGEAAQLLEQSGVFDELGGLFFFAGADGVGAELVDGLRREAEVPHDGYASAEDALDGLADLGAALHLDTVGVRLLHHADGRGEGLFGVALVGAEGEVDDDQRAADGLDDRLAVVDHLIERDGQRGDVARHDVRGRVADQDNVHTGAVNDLRHRVIVSREHGDLLAALLHLVEPVGGDLTAVVCYGCGHDGAESF